MGPSDKFEEAFWRWFDQIEGSLERIVFIGGEPLLQEKFERYLDLINQKVEASRTDRSRHRMYINVISNFSVSDKRFNRFLASVKKFSGKFVFHVESSIESCGEKAEYIRHGLRWSQLERNIEKTLSLKGPNIRYGFQMAVNNLCITSLQDCLEYAHHLQTKYQRLIDYKENIVVNPDYLCPLILTPDFAVYLERCIAFVEKYLANPKYSVIATDSQENSHERWRLYLPFLESLRKGIQEPNRDHTPARRKFFEFVKRNDARRNLNFLRTFPEYTDFYRLCEKEASSARIA